MLAASVVLLAVLVVLVLLQHPAPRPSPTTDRPANQTAAVSAAARTEAAAVLQMDYRHPGRYVAAVLAGATGSFRSGYSAQAGRLTAAARHNRSMSAPRIRQVATSSLGRGRAWVLVAADARVSASGAAPTMRYYRLRLQLRHVGGRWLLADLEFVG